MVFHQLLVLFEPVPFMKEHKSSRHCKYDCEDTCPAHCVMPCCEHNRSPWRIGAQPDFVAFVLRILN